MFKEDGQEYAQVTKVIPAPVRLCPLSDARTAKMLGNGRVEAQCFDGETRLCHIRGKLRKKVFFPIAPQGMTSWFLCSSLLFAQVWINQGDIILVGLRDFQDNKADIILKYNVEEARR